MFCDIKNKYYVGLYDSGKAHLFADCIQAGPLFIQGGSLRYDSDVNNKGELALVRSVQTAIICLHHRKWSVDNWRFYSDETGCLWAARKG